MPDMTPTKVRKMPRAMASHPSTFLSVSLATDYVVTVRTGSEKNAGTDAGVLLSLNGDKNKIAKRPLIKPESGKNPFEKNAKDVFKFNDVGVGKVRSSTLETFTPHDS